MNVKEKFLELTKQTYPHGSESKLFGLLPDFLKQDEFGNLYHQIGDNPTTMFTSHLDTASHTQESVTHVVKDNMIYSDGSTILGADDKAGVVVLLYLIEQNVTGLYYFFLGEERGCIGSRKVASKHKGTKMENINKVISFDRRGYDSVITHQLSGRSCSNEFAKIVSNKLNEVSTELGYTFHYETDPTGIYTDSAQFTDIYSECTNISVGYQNEHTKYEQQDIEHLRKLCEVSSKIDWDSIESFRNLNVKQSYYEYWDEEDYFETNPINSYENKTWKLSENSTSSVTILDTEFYGHESRIEFDRDSLQITNVNLHPARVLKEKDRIDKLLTSLEVEFFDLKWDGNMLTIINLNDKDFILKRQEIEEYLTDLNHWIETELRYKKFI
jgi:hypothetical protein